MTTNTATAGGVLNADALRKQANLKLLQRTCRSTIVDILVSATHVVLYEYRSSWHKTTQEGTLFVVVDVATPSTPSTTSSSHTTTTLPPLLPTYTMILLNRHSTDNFEMNITSDFQIQQQEPFLMFKHDQRVWGIWFHSPTERQQVYDMLQQTTLSLSTMMMTTNNNNNNTPWTLPLSKATTTTTTTASIPTTNPFSWNDVNEAVQEVIAPVVSSTMLSTSSSTTTTTTIPTSTIPAIATTTGSSHSTIPSQPSPSTAVLDKKALQLALLSLLQEDKFLTLLHQQYLKAIRSKQQQQQQLEE